MNDPHRSADAREFRAMQEEDLPLGDVAITFLLEEHDPICSRGPTHDLYQSMFAPDGPRK